MRKAYRILLWAVGLCLLTAIMTWASPTAEDQGVAGETVKLTVELFDRNRVPKEEGTLEDNRWTRWIKEEMLKRGVDVEFFPVPRGEERTKLAILMGSGTAPDIVFTYNRFLFAQFALDGGLHDLTGSLDEHGATIKKILGDEILDYGILDGKQYAVPARRSSTAHRTAWVRKDWMEELNLDLPTDRDELVNVLKAFKAKDPGGMRDQLIPWGLFDATPVEFEPHNFRAFNAMYSFMEDDLEKMYTTPWPLREGFKPFMAWINSVYRAGLVDQEFATDTDELREQKIMNGQVGFFATSHWSPTNVGYGDWYRNLRKNIPGAELEPVEVFKNKDGRYRKITYPPVGLYIFSPTTARNTDAVIKYLDWHAQEEVGWTMSFGIEGEHYKLQDGAPLPIDPDHNSKTFGYIIGDLRLLFNGPYPIPTEAQDKITVIANGDLGEFALASQKMAERDGFPEIVFNEEIQAWSKYGPEISKAYDEYWAKMVTTNDFEATYAEFMKEIEDRNIQEVAAERAAYYRKYY